MKLNILIMVKFIHMHQIKSFNTKLIFRFLFPLIYSFIILNWEYANIFFNFLMKDLSLLLYRIFYLKNSTIKVVKPLDDVIIYILLCWIFIFIVLASLKKIIKNKDIIVGISYTIVIHLLLLLVLGFELFRNFL